MNRSRFSEEQIIGILMEQETARMGAGPCPPLESVAARLAKGVRALGQQ